MLVMTKVINGACRLMTMHPIGMSSWAERTSAIGNLGIFHLRYRPRCVLMVSQRGHMSLWSYQRSSVCSVKSGALSSQLTSHRLNRSVSSQSSNILNQESTKEGNTVETETVQRGTGNNPEKNSLPETLKTPQDPAESFQQSLETTLPNSQLENLHVPAAKGKCISDTTMSSKRVNTTAKLPSEKTTKNTANSRHSTVTPNPKASASSKKKTKKKVTTSDKKVQTQNKNSSTNPNQTKTSSMKVPTSTSRKTIAQTANQRKKSGNQRTGGSSASSCKTAKTAKTENAKSKLNVVDNGKTTTEHQGNVGGNHTASVKATTDSAIKPPPHLANETRNISNTFNLSDSDLNSSNAGQLLGQRSMERAGQCSSYVTPAGHHVQTSQNIGGTSAIANKPHTTPEESVNVHTDNKSSFFRTINFKSMSQFQSKAINNLDKRRHEVIDKYRGTAPLDKMLGLDESIESADELMEGGLKRKKSVKKEKQHNWTIVKTPQAYLQPFMDVSIFCGMVQDAQALFNSARNHGLKLDPKNYNTMLQAWARKGDLAQVRSLFTQMSAQGVKPNEQSYAAALECMARTNGIVHSTVTKCLEEMESENLSPSDIFHVCTFTNDSREVILRLIQDVRPGFEAPPPLPRPECQLHIVHDLYHSMNSAPKMVDNSNPEILSQEEILSKLDEQMNMEKFETVKVSSVEPQNILSNHTLSKRAVLEEHQTLWRKALQKTLKYEIQKFRKRNDPRRATLGKLNLYPFLSIMEQSEYVELMLEALQGLASSTEGSMTVALSRELGYRVQRKYMIRQKIKTGVADKMMTLYKQFVSQSLNADSLNHRALWQKLEDESPEGPTLNPEVHSWPPIITLGLGSVLADIMIREIKININMSNSKKDKKMIPALYYMYTYRSFKQVGYIKPHPTLVELLQQVKEPQMLFESNQLPMLSPPIPWSSVKFGAYPLSTTKIMRCRDDTRQHQSLLEKSKSAELYPVLDSLNQLAAVPWIINKPVLDVIISVFRKGGSEVMDIAQLPSVLPTVPKPTGESTPEQLAKIQQQRAALRKQQAEMHSLRMDMLYKLSIADKYRDEVMWFPHNMDFRGRVYPCPPYLNHMGSDVTRSILSFAKGLPLGKEGLDWIKIHLVNLTGHKKRCSLAERLAYANEMMPGIVDSAENPLEGYGWWTTAEDKWQVLACCMEINKIINHHGDPSTYISHLPIHQDGSCNGLQHYAALGRDVIGAHQVNLCNTEIPQDVYSGVAQMVEEICQKDAANGLPVAQLLQGQIHRKVVKQTVMTVVYGVTQYGGKLQILKQLKDMSDIPPDQRQFAAGYLVLKVFQCLRKMFSKTREIQDWLTECAWLISKAGQTVEWVTPLGLPVVQPYHKKNLLGINHANHLMYHEDRSDTSERPDSIKQKNAFPPNFIHSLDSTHMMLTSLYCHRAGINFASVHDCFWTHAATIPTMNRICREQFVRLHSEEILQMLADFMLQKYGHLEIPPTSKLKKLNPQLTTIGEYIVQVPQKGDFDLNNVLQSTFFFS